MKHFGANELMSIRNYSGRVHKTPVQSHAQFLMDQAPHNVMIINSKQMNDFIIRGVIRILNDFDVVIFEDLYLKND